MLVLITFSYAKNLQSMWKQLQSSYLATSSGGSPTKVGSNASTLIQKELGIIFSLTTAKEKRS